MQRRLYIDEAHTALDIFRFVDLKNEDDLKNEADLKNEDDL